MVGVGRTERSFRENNFPAMLAGILGFLPASVKAQAICPEDDADLSSVPVAEGRAASRHSRRRQLVWPAELVCDLAESKAAFGSLRGLPVALTI